MNNFVTWRSPTGFSGSGISFIWNAGFGILKQNAETKFGIESMRGRWDTKNNPRVTGLNEILGRDYGIEELYWETSVIYVFIISLSYTQSEPISLSTNLTQLTAPLSHVAQIPCSIIHIIIYYISIIYTRNIPNFPSNILIMNDFEKHLRLNEW